MGLLIKGVWHDQWYDTASTGGRFVRSDAQFRRWIEADARAPFPAEANRYHLYVSYACPWAHRTLIFRRLKQLQSLIGVSVVDPLMREQGWRFSNEPGCLPDSHYGSRYLHEIYTRAQPDYSGRVTVPVLWDTKTQTIVNNESSDIIRMLNQAFAAVSPVSYDFYPESLRAEIDAVNELVYRAVNDGVYRCGFATTQRAYEQAFDELFAALEQLERRLGGQPYLCGDRVTEADWRLFTTLFRFDLVYFGHFKCNLKRIRDYPNLYDYLAALYQTPGVAETCHIDHIKKHYYGSHETINPTGIVPKGPACDLSFVPQRPVPAS